jgi:hypothetical protein
MGSVEWLWQSDAMWVARNEAIFGNSRRQCPYANCPAGRLYWLTLTAPNREPIYTLVGLAAPSWTSDTSKCATRRTFHPG